MTNRVKTTGMLAAERHRDYREVVEELKALRQQFQLAVRDLPTAVPASTARDIDRGIESRERRARHVAAIRVDRVLELLMSVERLLALAPREWGSPEGTRGDSPAPDRLRAIRAAAARLDGRASYRLSANGGIQWASRGRRN